ncbi:alpha/beta hydrolase [Hymenobacter actinosclerus]|uniref:Alpha/beta hydrolase family protein n=1 Tax=Hymenobacter actinosclerus TaxID=82805 RepID=A0A1I0BQ68_9BACT|nr:alpha/beta hydrolase [Hymenobacter actinosclerus]SET09146.1 Alpha/beta hydrolase family protein [Hymenobacter actinosclerus]
MKLSTLPARPVAAPVLPPGIKLLRLKFRLLAALSTEWAFRAAWRLFTTPRRLPEKGWETAALATARRFAVPGPTGALAAYEWNPAGARTVLLVHGWEHRASFWGVLARALVKAGYRVVAFDAPGHGASEGRRLTLPAYVRATQAVADTLGPLHAVVAHSLGGATVVGGPVRFNTTAGGGLPRLVLLAVPASTPAVARRFADLLGLPPAVLARMSRYIHEQHGRDAESFSLTQVGAAFPAGRALLLHDEHDASIPFAEARELAAAWPDLEFGATSGLGHNGIMREPAVLARIVAFLT